MIKLNKYLFEWVIENICKNAVDAMEGVGALKVVIKKLKNSQIAIDISDTGKGIAKKNLSKVFNPGFSTKKRGWGLGLTLAKRIIENYHDGKLTVKSSEVNKGTTFRILLGGAD
jgi:signal transduction histidine kinase